MNAVEDARISAIFAEPSGRLPSRAPLGEVVTLLVDAWAEAAVWKAAKASARPRERGVAPPPLPWHPPLVPRRFSPATSEIIRAYHDRIDMPPPPPQSERFGDDD